MNIYTLYTEDNTFICDIFADEHAAAVKKAATLVKVLTNKSLMLIKPKGDIETVLLFSQSYNLNLVKQ